MKYLLIAGVMLVSPALAQQTTFRAPNGSIVGRAAQSGNMTVFYSANGSITGRSITTGNTTIFYDARGSIVGRTTK